MNDRTQALGAIVRRLAVDRHDEDSWKELYALLWPYVFSVTYRYLGGVRHLAEDATQDVFARLVRNFPFDRVQGGKAAREYIRAMAVNAARDLLRRAIPYQVDVRPDREGHTPHTVASQVDLHRRLEFRDAILTALADLPATDRQLFALIAQGRNLPEAAARLKISYGNAGVKLHRLRKRIRRVLGLHGLVVDH